MSVEADQSWTPQYGDVGQNKNLPVYEETKDKKSVCQDERETLRALCKDRSKTKAEEPQEMESDSKESGSFGIEDSSSKGTDCETGCLPAMPEINPNKESSRPSHELLGTIDSGMDLPRLPPVGTPSVGGGQILTAGDIRAINIVTPSYKDELTRAMDELAKDPLIRFVGYGVQIGRAMGTLKNVPYSQLVEVPVAENLMVSFAIGLSLKGLKPVVFIERFDFILNALDAIVNHLDKIGDMSHGEFNPTMIFRIVVGNRNKPLFTGKTHTQDFSPALRSLVSFPVVGLMAANQIAAEYKDAHVFLDRNSTALIEYKDLI